MGPNSEASGYVWENAGLNASHAYLLPGLKNILEGLEIPQEKRRLFDLGCGNGSVANELVRLGWEVAGVDPSEQGIAHANTHFPHITLRVGSAYDDLVAQYGTFPVVVSLEVVEHLYAPRRYAKTLYSLLDPGGVAIVSTPYHGYLKNLALAVTGRMDAHFTALWDHGHIKFWSIKTLRALLEEVGFRDIRFHRVGRIPPLAKSMIAVACKSPS
ncbi:MAG TPA: class I SAM-dependent methyltransferase [Nevskiales bacterium]|nr:class I SAM-dependent methyltransferase [Nevskiales bacterium]